jgi:cytochrome b pre-mRNA-processing protein 3
MRSLMAMLRPKGDDAATLYGALIAEARRPGWYLDGGVPDTLDGRFAVLSTLTALTILRLEDGNEETARHSVALTESFIADMDAQMREAGFGDPSLGKQVRHLVGALASRVDRWRGAKADASLWTQTTARSLFGDGSPSESAATFAGDSLRRFDEGLSGSSDRDLMSGRIG